MNYREWHDDYYSENISEFMLPRHETVVVSPQPLYIIDRHSFKRYSAQCVQYSLPGH